MVVNKERPDLEEQKLALMDQQVDHQLHINLTSNLISNLIINLTINFTIRAVKLIGAAAPLIENTQCRSA